MENKAISIILIFFGTLILVSLAYSFIGPIIHYLFQLIFKREKEHNVDLDILIRKQKMLMGSKQPHNSENDQEFKTSSKTIKKYSDFFQNEPQNTELKTILKIFDEIQWGDGSFIKEQNSYLKNKYKIDQSPSSLSKNLNVLIQKEYFISLHNKELASLNQIKKALRLKSLYETLNHQCYLRRGDTVDFLAKKYHMSPLSIMLSFELIVLKATGKSSEQAYNAVTSQSAKETSLLPEKDAKIFTKILFKENRLGFQSIEEFTDLLAVESKAIEFILPLPKILNEKDINSAYKIFNASEKTSTEEIKKIYKKMAVSKHPDKLNSYGIPKKYEKIASENFSRLKNAYDIILKSRKE